MPARMAEFVSRAFYAAMAGRPGPVVLALPRDMLGEHGRCRRRAALRAGRNRAGRGRNGGASDDLLAPSKRRCFILGGGRWNEARLREIARFAERFAMPVVTSYRRCRLFDPLHPNYAGDLGLGPNPKLVARDQSQPIW